MQVTAVRLNFCGKNGVPVLSLDVGGGVVDRVERRDGVVLVVALEIREDVVGPTVADGLKWVGVHAADLTGLPGDWFLGEISYKIGITQSHHQFIKSLINYILANVLKIKK